MLKPQRALGLEKIDNRKGPMHTSRMNASEENYSANRAGSGQRISTRFDIPEAEKAHERGDEGLLEARKKVLILDDDEVLTTIIKESLESNGFEVATVQDGVDGIKQIMAGDFDVILCDVVMPKIPGDMFYQAVKWARPHLCKRFIFMTGYKGDPKIAAFIRQVKGLMLWKPFENHVLLEAINVILKKAQLSEAK